MRALIGGIMEWASDTGRDPVGRKSFWTSTSSKALDDGDGRCMADGGC